MDLSGASLVTYIPAALNYLGQQETNNTNVQMNDRNNQINQAEAQKNRDWQQYMSNTSIQRQVQDLKAAGINPMLAANGGASTPSGAQATANAGHVDNPYSGAIASAMEAKKLGMAADLQNKQMESLDAGIKNTKADTVKKMVESKVLSGQIPEAELKNDLYDVARPLVKGIKSVIQGSPKMNSLNMKGNP